MSAVAARRDRQNGRVGALRRPPKAFGAARRPYLAVSVAVLLLLLLFGCGHREKSVSGTIEVDEAHVGPRSGGRVEKIFAQEGDHLHEGQLIAQLEADELRARRDLAKAQIDTATRNVDAQAAQLEYLQANAQREKELLQRKVVSPNEAQQAESSAKSQEKNVEAARAQVMQMHAQLADIDAQLAEMQVVAPAECVLETLSVKVGDILVPPFNQEVATVLLMQHLWVRVYVPETWLGFIHDGDKVRVRVDPFPGVDFPGVVEQINRQAEFTPRNVQTVGDRIKQVFGVKVRLPADDHRLRAGMAADVYFPNVR